MKTMSMLTYSQFQLCFNLTKPLNKEIKRSNISEMSFHLVSVPCLHEVKMTKKTMCSIKCDQSPLVISKTYLALYCTRALFEFLCAKSLLQSAVQALLTFRRLRPLVQVFYIYLFLLIIWISQLKTKKGKYSFVQLKTTEECASVSIKLSKQSGFCKPIKPAFQAHDKSKGEHSGNRSIKRK